MLISHPMRLDANGWVVAVDEGSDRAAAELAGHVVSTQVGERPLSAPYGLSEIDPGLIPGVVALCEPEIKVLAVEVTPSGPGRLGIRMDVGWSEA